MAINKRKILQSAQKSLQKGAFDKALKDYKTLLEADPKDVNLRLKVGDVYLKQGKNDEAVAAYSKVAERFMKDGFDAKAVALYKQITKIDPKRVDVYVPLSELYQRLGLISDAMGALQTAADAHYREGDKPAALELLRKMAKLDPANTTSRLKVAELLRQEGMTAEALAEFEAVAEELERQEEVEGRVSVLQKILELDPVRGKALEGLGRAYLLQRKWSQAEEVGHSLVGEVAEFAVEGYEILVESVAGLGRTEEIPDLYQAMAHALRERGDDARARELVQRYCGGGALSAEGGDLPHLENDEEAAAFDAAVGGDGAFGADELDDPGFVTDSGLRLGSPDVERDAIDGRRRAATSTEASNRDMPLAPLHPDEETGKGESDAPTPEGDPEQLVAEASVYLRYGKSERAIESLRAALAQEPNHRVALEKLGDALQAADDAQGAVSSWLRAAECAYAAGDASVAEALRARAVELDPDAVPTPSAELLAPPAADESELGAEIRAEDSDGMLPEDDDIEIEIDESAFEDAVDEPPTEEIGADLPLVAGSVEDDATVSERDDELQLEEEISPEEDLDDIQGDASSEIETSEEEFLTDEPVSEEFLTDEPVGDEFLTDEPVSDEPASEQLHMDEAVSDEPLTDEPVDDEELEFEVAVRDAATGDEPIPQRADHDETSGADLLHGADLDLDLDLDSDDPEDPAHQAAHEDAAAPELEAPEAGSSTTPQQIIEELEEGEFYFEQGLLDEAAEVYERILALAPNHPQAMVRLGEIEARTVAEGPRPAVHRSGGADITEEAVDTADDASLGAMQETDPGASIQDDDEVTGELPTSVDPVELEAEPPVGTAAEEAAGREPAAADEDEQDEEGGDFDLAAELSGVFDDAAPAVTSRGSAGTEEEGFEQVFAAFKAGVEKELGDEDHEARYDLGIAYKEMGLLDDAIGEFRVAMQDVGRQLECLHMMSICALDLGRPEDAVAHLEQALALPEMPDEQQVALRFDLGRAEEARGDRARARDAWEAVSRIDPGFQDVSQRLAALDREPPPEDDSDDDDGEALESFDDLIDGGVSAAVGADSLPGAEEYESFDDLISDDESEEDEDSEAEDCEGVGAVADAEIEPAAEAGELEPGADVTQVAEVTAEETEEPVSDVEAPESESNEAASAEPTVDEPDLDPEPSAPKKRRRKKISFM